jgi:hypothetical protein
MSTDLHSRTQSLSLTRFSGRNTDGPCVQVTCKVTHANFSLTRHEAACLAADLHDFAHGFEVEDHD